MFMLTNTSIDWPTLKKKFPLLVNYTFVNDFPMENDNIEMHPSLLTQLYCNSEGYRKSLKVLEEKAEKLAELLQGGETLLKQIEDRDKTIGHLESKIVNLEAEAKEKQQEINSLRKGNLSLNPVH